MSSLEKRERQLLGFPVTAKRGQSSYCVTNYGVETKDEQILLLSVDESIPFI